MNWQRLRLLQIEHVEAFGEPAVHRSELAAASPDHARNYNELVTDPASWHLASERKVDPGRTMSSKRNEGFSAGGVVRRAKYSIGVYQQRS